MTEKRSLIVFGQLHESEQKFDYFVTGLTGALCGFIAEGYTATKLGRNAPTLELAAILVLVISFWFGFRRIQWGIVVKRLNALLLHTSEVKGALASNFQGGPLMNASTGDVFLPDTVLKLIKKHGEDHNAIKESLAVAERKALTAYDWRNGLLFAGFVVLIVSKVAKAYI